MNRKFQAEFSLFTTTLDLVWLLVCNCNICSFLFAVVFLLALTTFKNLQEYSLHINHLSILTCFESSLGIGITLQPCKVAECCKWSFTYSDSKQLKNFFTLPFIYKKKTSNTEDFPSPSPRSCYLKTERRSKSYRIKN